MLLIKFKCPLTTSILEFAESTFNNESESPNILKEPLVKRIIGYCAEKTLQ